MSLRRP